LIPHYFLSSAPSSAPRSLHSFPTRRSSDLDRLAVLQPDLVELLLALGPDRVEGAVVEDVAVLVDLDERRALVRGGRAQHPGHVRSEEHTSELQSRGHLVCRLLLEKKNKTRI